MSLDGRVQLSTSTLYGAIRRLLDQGWIERSEAASGLGQWLLLRRRLPRAGWWIVANVTGWSLFVLITGPSLDQFWFMVLGALPACATAVTFWLLTNQAQPAELQSA